MTSEKIPDPLKTKNVGDHPDGILIVELYNDGRVVQSYFGKVQDLRYADNPSQTAAQYGHDTFLGTLRELKTGKQGPSLTNMEDIIYATVSVGFFDAPTVAIMKHENPSGFATQYEKKPLVDTYEKACDADRKAAFGGADVFNTPIDKDTAEAIRELFTEVLVAPGYEEGVVDSFKGSIRIFEYNPEKFMAIPRFTGDPSGPRYKSEPDGTLMRYDPLLTPIGTTEELKRYVVSERQPTGNELRDLLTGYRIRLRSNSIRLVKNGYTTGIGTGQRDRVSCIAIAASLNRDAEAFARKNGLKRVADYSIPGSSLISDGFFPQTDSIELAHSLGITAVLAPHGGENFNKVVAKANEYGMAFVDLPGQLRFFSHH